MTSEFASKPRAASLISVALLFIAVCATTSVHAQSTAAANDRYLVRAKRILKTTPLIDGHNDLPWRIRAPPDPARPIWTGSEGE